VSIDDEWEEGINFLNLYRFGERSEFDDGQRRGRRGGERKSVLIIFLFFVRNRSNSFPSFHRIDPQVYYIYVYGGVILTI
jgi:hypothetical protein